ncbi:MAG: nucleoside 2-deoxyribosyltransferase [Verrucomicrobia bacterium]|nr:nucleoside 2-deoxyribosyltransferase [Verrucomicrobiota bacterium]MBV9657918.1 nucleoside 2-deoxyribosyltransferase [Verrucomicrobiota bacterium]
MADEPKAPPTSSTPTRGKTYTIYFAGELFSSKHLLGNAALAEAIYALSEGRYISVLPQNLEQREASAHSIRDQDIQTLLSCDLGLFNYDGPELDSGTVVEYLFAKFADIPSVLLRTDFRQSGDQDKSGDAWNLMNSFYPRTRVVQLDSMTLYQEAFKSAGGFGNEKDAAAVVLDQGRSLEAARLLVERIASQAIAAFDAVLSVPPLMPKMLTEAIYQWLALMPGFRMPENLAAEKILGYCIRKQGKGLL